jgi:carboxypeptidase C (cathepsin A)
MYHQTSDWVAALLERNIRVLVYVGSSDWICNWIGNEKWTLAMDWSGKEEFNKQSLRQWMVDGKVAGVTRTSGNFTFATIDGAGHYVSFWTFVSSYVSGSRRMFSRCHMINRKSPLRWFEDG